MLKPIPDVKLNLDFILLKTGLVTIEQGRLYADLMDWREKGDYGDMFDFDRESVEPIFKPLKELITVIKKLIRKDNA